MADLTKIKGAKNGSVTLTETAAASTQTIPTGKDEYSFIYVNNGSGASVTATVLKGNGIAATADLAVTVAAGTKAIIGPLESAKYTDITTGKLTLTLSATTSVTVAAVQL